MYLLKLEPSKDAYMEIASVQTSKGDSVRQRCQNVSMCECQK